MAKTSQTKSGSVQKQRVTKAAAAKPSKAAPGVKTAKAPAKKAVPATPRGAKASAKPVATAKKKAPAAPKKKAAPAAATKPAAAAKGAAKTAAANKLRFSKVDLKQFQLELLAMRDRISNQSGSMKTAALQRSEETNLEEDGTGAFMRLQALEQVGSQQILITKINEALHAISKGKYGICDTCGDLINKVRLSVLPFARNCIKCQSEMEQVIRHGRFR